MAEGSEELFAELVAAGPYKMSNARSIFSYIVRIRITCASSEPEEEVL